MRAANALNSHVRAAPDDAGTPDLAEDRDERHWDAVSHRITRWMANLAMGRNHPEWHTVLYTPTVSVTPRMIDKELHQLSERLAVIRTEGLKDPRQRSDPHSSSPFTELLIVDEEHVWRHTRHGDKYVTVIIDLTPVRARTGPARLLDMIEGRSKQVFSAWLAERPQDWRDRIEIVAMDGFTGFKTATTEELPDAVAVMDPFHVIRLAGDALDQCRRRVQQALHGHRAGPLTRSTGLGGPCTPVPICSLRSRRTGWPLCSSPRNT